MQQTYKHLPDRVRDQNELFNTIRLLDRRFKKEKLFDKNLVKLIIKYDKHKCDFYSTKNGLYRCRHCDFVIFEQKRYCSECESKYCSGNCSDSENEFNFLFD